MIKVSIYYFHQKIDFILIIILGIFLTHFTATKYNDLYYFLLVNYLLKLRYLE